MKALSIIAFIASIGLFSLAGYVALSAVPGGYTWAYATAIVIAFVGALFLGIGIAMFKSRFMSNSILPLLIFVGIIVLIAVWGMAYTQLASPN